MHMRWESAGSAQLSHDRIHEERTDLHYMSSDFDADCKLDNFTEYLSKFPTHVTIQDSKCLHTPSHIAAYTGNVLLLGPIVDFAPDVVIIQCKQGKYCDECLPPILRFIHNRRFQDD